MLKQLAQAAIITFTLYLLMGMSIPSPAQDGLAEGMPETTSLTRSPFLP
jgi:hypothetical protein